MNAYADTSFLVSLYSPDANSARAASTIQHLAPTLLFTPLGELELANALELRVFRQEASSSEAKAALGKIQEHIEAGFLSLRPMPMSAYDSARRMAHRRTARLGVRSLDILHVAAALLLRADAFLTFDDRQRRLARVEGLQTR